MMVSRYSATLRLHLRTLQDIRPLYGDQGQDLSLLWYRSLKDQSKEKSIVSLLPYTPGNFEACKRDKMSMQRDGNMV